MRFFKVVFVFLFIAGSAVLFADSPLSDPAIPDNEHICYSVSIENLKFFRTIVTKQKTENGRAIYTITSESKNEDQRLKIDRRNMEVVYSWTKMKERYYSVEKEITTIVNNIPVGENEIAIIEFLGMTHMLRGYPYNRPRDLRVKTSQSGDILILVKFIRETDVATAVGTIRCYEIEVGLDGILGIFFPKTHAWYTKAAPHYLVKYEGISGGPGSPVMKMEITAYSLD